MPKIMSLEDQQVGKGQGDYFKIEAKKEKPQRFAHIPSEITLEDLSPSEELKEKAAKGDQEALDTLQEIQNLRATITRQLQKKTAEEWTNPEGKKVILFPKVIQANTFWIDSIGYVYDVPGIPDECKGKYGSADVYGLVVMEYMVDDEGDVRRLSESEKIDLGNGVKLDFRYELKLANFKKAEINAFKEHTGQFGAIKHDYKCWKEKQGNSARSKFAPCAESVWRENPILMAKIIVEARKLYGRVPGALGKQMTRDEILKCFPHLGKAGTSTAASQTHTEDIAETDFEALLGGKS